MTHNGQVQHLAATGTKQEGNMVKTLKKYRKGNSWCESAGHTHKRTGLWYRALDGLKDGGNCF